MTLRTLGVEEEMLLVDPDSCRLAAVAHRALAAHRQGASQPTVGVVPAGEQGQVEGELFLQQLETATKPVSSADELATAIRAVRREAGEAAREAGARAVAMAVPVLVDPEEHLTPKPRYERIGTEYGEMARQGLVCAMHVHVSVDGDEEAVRVVDGIRPWLPVLLALSANSPYWRGHDTGHASWRSQIWGRWPSAGQAEPFGDVETYRTTAETLMSWGASIDPAMLYFDIRLAESFPTVEIRVPDVCTEPDDAVLVALLTRALVETTASGPALDPWRADLLRAATWRAARYGIGGPLVNPVTRELAPTRAVVAALLDHTRGALDEAGDTGLVTDLFERMLARGNGAQRQRSVRESTGSLEAVVKDLADRTERSWRDA